MVPHFLKILKYNPLPGLAASKDPALLHFVARDLLAEDSLPPYSPWNIPAVQKILKKQQPDGAWASATGRVRSNASNYCLIETWKALRLLIGKYGMNIEDPSIQKAAEFVFTCQMPEGDFRGFIANQYAPYYTGALMGLLNQAGYGRDPRIEKGFRWLLSLRQADGGWTIPILTRNFDWKTMYRLTSRFAEPVEPDPSKPFSHNWTGMVLRAFAAHDVYRKSDAAQRACALQKGRFFQKDVYSSYQSAETWVKFDYPFWWNNLVASLDSISLIDTTIDEPLDRAVRWLAAHQRSDGMWNISYVKAGQKTAGARVSASKSAEMRPWITLAVCRILQRMFP